MKLRLLDETLAVCRLDVQTRLPDWLPTQGFRSITLTPNELSIVADEEAVPNELEAERGWRALMIEGPLDFNLTGVLAGLADPLAKAGVSIFAVSTYDTDYVLVRSGQLKRARAALAAAGYEFASTG